MINPEWLKEDETTEAIVISNADLSAYYAAAEREIKIAANYAGVPSSKIPVDENGYVTSYVLQQYGITYLMMRLFSGYWGKRFGNNSGSQDIYRDKMDTMQKELDRLRGMITAQTVIGTESDDSETVVSPDSLIREVRFVV